MPDNIIACVIGKRGISERLLPCMIPNNIKSHSCIWCSGLAVISTSCAFQVALYSLYIRMRCHLSQMYVL